MKATKLIAFIAIAGFGLMAGEVIAQGNDDDAPPKMSEFNESESNETEPYNESVTIDKGDGSGASANSGGGFSDGTEKKERLRVYSGKHDGNNVIVDPRR